VSVYSCLPQKALDRWLAVDKNDESD